MDIKKIEDYEKEQDKKDKKNSMSKRTGKVKNTSFVVIDTKTGRSKKVGAKNSKIKKRFVVIDTKTGSVSYKDAPKKQAKKTTKRKK